MFAGTISVVGEADEYEFAATPGEFVAVAVGRTAGGDPFDPAFVLTDADGNELSTACTEGDGCGRPRIELGGLPPYRITVFERDFNAAGDYTLTLAPVTDAFPAEACSTAIACGAPSTASLPIGGIDSYVFDATPGGFVAIAVGRTAGGDPFDPAFMLTDADGNELSTACTEGDGCGRPRIELGGLPPYRITVFERDFNAAGDYLLALAPLTDAFPGQEACREEISGCLCGMAVTASIEPAEIHSYTFAAEPGDVVAIGISRTAGGEPFDPDFTLTNGDGDLLETCCAVAAGETKAGIALSGSPPYTITVFEDDFSAAGSYALAVDTCAGPCRVGPPGRSLVVIRDRSSETGDLLKWKWKQGEASTFAELCPAVDGIGEYRLCVYDAVGEVQALMEMRVPAPGGLCDGRPCWRRAGGAGCKFRDGSGTPDGLTAMSLKGHDAGKAAISITGKGQNLPDPMLALTGGVLLPLTVQLTVDDGASRRCWETTFSSARKNDATQVKAKGP